MVGGRGSREVVGAAEWVCLEVRERVDRRRRSSGARGCVGLRYLSEERMARDRRTRWGSAGRADSEASSV